MKYDLSENLGQEIFALKNMNLKIESNLKVGIVGRTVRK
jgi:hypothetical protein